MALLGFLKAKKDVAMPPPPLPPRPSMPPQFKIQLGNISPRHMDDLEKPMPVSQGPLFPDIPKLDLPELEPAEEEKETFFDSPPEEKEEHLFVEPSGNIPANLPELEQVEIPAEIPEDLPELEVDYSSKIKKAPLFINVDVFSGMMEKLNTIRAKLSEYVSATGRVEELKTRKEASMEKWRTNLEDIERKLLLIDRIFFGGG